MLILIYVSRVERGNDACKIDDIKRRKNADLENMWSATILSDQVIYRMTRSICHYTNIHYKILKKNENVIYSTR